MTRPPQKELTTQILDAGLVLDTRTEEPAIQVEPDAEIVAELERASEGQAETPAEGEAEAETEAEAEPETEPE